jgi:hypothetical protein
MNAQRIHGHFVVRFPVVRELSSSRLFEMCYMILPEFMANDFPIKGDVVA